MTFMTVGELREQLKQFPNEDQICMTSRIQRGTSITSINYVGRDRHGNAVITFDDNLLKKEVDVT
jgi:hypothetical protein